MSAGTLILLLLIGGALFAMFVVHRRGGSYGMGGGCMGGHSHTTPEDRNRADRPKDTQPTAGSEGQHDHDQQPTPAGRHRGC